MAKGAKGRGERAATRISTALDLLSLLMEDVPADADDPTVALSLCINADSLAALQKRAREAGHLSGNVVLYAREVLEAVAAGRNPLELRRVAKGAA